MHRQCEICGTAGWSRSVLCIDCEIFGTAGWSRSVLCIDCEIFGTLFRVFDLSVCSMDGN